MSSSSSSSSRFPNPADHASHQQQPKRHQSKHQLQPASALRLRSRHQVDNSTTPATTHQRRLSTYSTSSTVLTNITSSETYSSLLKQIRSSDPSSTPSNYHEQQRLAIASYGAQSPIRKTIGTLIKSGQSRSSIILYSILFILLWKSLVGLGHYSGHRSPPLFGDLEAQRHWMALTVQLKLKQWYSFDLQYWGLDYPPLTAYHSLVLGYLARLVDPAFVLLRPPSNHPNGWGEELHQQLKLFLRSSVLASELLLWIPIVLIYHFKTFTFNSSSLDTSNHLSHTSNPPRLSNGLWLGAMYSVLVVLLNPNLILIDNGHFQFNSIMLGLTLASVTCFYGGHDLLGAVMFVCSLAFKQMALYYSPAIFAYLFGKCLYLGHPRGTKLFTRLALISTGSTILLFAPFIFNSDFPLAIIQVIQRIFPIGRGLFEDKVGNFWCTLNLFIKVRTLASVKTLANIALLFTLGAVLPVILLLTILSWKLNPSPPSISSSSSSSSKVSLLTSDPSNPIPKTVELLPLALYNSSIGFYLFSFQVHEKSILLPVLPLLLILSRHHRNRKRGQLVNWQDWDIICLISNVSVFSMWPLLKREQLGVQYMVSIISYNHLIGYSPLKLIKRSTGNLVSLGIMSIYLAMIGIHLSEQLIKPPARLPDLFVVLNHSLSFVVFSASYLWSLLRIYEEAWTLVGFGRLSHHLPEPAHPSETKSLEQEHDKREFEKDQAEGSMSEVNEEDEDPSEALQLKLPAKRSSSLQQQRRKKKKSGSDSEGEELKSRSFGATPRMLKGGPLPQRMLKEPAGSGSRPSSKVMISSPSGEKLMNRIKNRLLVSASRSASPSSSSSTSQRSSSAEDRRGPGSKGKEKEDENKLDDQGGNPARGGQSDDSYSKDLEYHSPQHHHHHLQNLVAVTERDERRQPDKQEQEQEERDERRREQRERERQNLSSSPYRLESAWEQALRQSREEAIRRRREELLATRTPTNSSSKR
ncbi:hypothetical protein PtA15_6A323 [Puccinia triticina]|uniref:dolichyl-P-Glc:Man9GlcNAc2-PP-dolichol alpha-1,3-glucosyltransferase n=1 Tax=Puccinia triticina TaxID=208348 RepID=A0ABY7CLW7_9BASI|nr:uncharacterized protein PtA15_6A323 [Puccinia triticina]WAQ85695.1 hypothetical protein PtA15_6A323 [Puccinia triticina]